MSPYVPFYLGSFFLFTVLSSSLLKAAGLGRKFRNLFVLIYLVGMMLGAHAFYFAFAEHTLTNLQIQAFYADLSDGRGRWLSELWDIRSAAVGLGGLWGGPWFALLALLPFVVFLRLDLDTKHGLLDAFAVSFCYALALAKVGCLAWGCCYGVEGTGPLTMRFTWVPRSSPIYMERRFPTQLVDLLLYLAIGVALLVMHLRSRQRGRLILWFALLYSLGRFATEFTRGDEVGGKVAGLSPVQVVLITSFIASVVLLLRGRLADRVLTAWGAGVRPGQRLLSKAIRERIERMDRNLLLLTVALLLICFFFPALSFLLLLLAVPVLVRLGQALRGSGDPARWTGLFNAFACFALVLLFVTAFLTSNLVPFYVSAVASAVVSVFLLNRFFASIAPDAGLSGSEPALAYRLPE